MEGTPGGPSEPPASGEQQLTPEQERMLEQMEEEMRRVRVEDLIAQSVVSILNLSARRIVKEDERDLAQARIGIDAVRSLVEHLDAEAQNEIKNALSQIQMLYARHVGETAAGDAPPSAATDEPETQRGPGAGEAGGIHKPPPGLWVPGSD